MTDSAAEMDSVVPENSPPVRSFAHTFGILLCIAGILGGLLLLIARVHFGSFRNVQKFVRGERLSVSPHTVDLGRVSISQQLTATVRITNLTLGHVTLLGAKPSCGCIAVANFPVTIRSGATHVVPLRIHTPPRTERIDHRVTIFTNAGGLEQLNVYVTGVADESMNSTALSLRER